MSDRGHATDDADAPDDVTLWAGRLRPWPAADDAADDTDVAADERTRVVRRRRAAPVDAQPVDAEPHPAPDADELPEHTVVRPATAPTTRRAAALRAPAAPEPDVRVPDALTREAYGPRHAEPVIVPRRPVAPPRALVDDAVPVPQRARLRAGWIVAAAVLAVLVVAAVVVAVVLIGA